jgi:tRNA-specific 2-thiouridylase
VAHGEEDRLFTNGLYASEFNFMPGTPETDKFNCTAKFRYRQEEQNVTVHRNLDGSVKIDFEVPQRAITEGQFAVFYDEEKCLGGGVIEKALF